MSPQSGMLEILLLAALALAVLGPKDLALLLRRLGRWTGKMRMAAYEFRQQLDVLGGEVEREKQEKTGQSESVSEAVKAPEDKGSANPDDGAP